MNKVWAKHFNLFGSTLLFTNFQFTVWLSAHYFSNDEFLVRSTVFKHSCCLSDLHSQARVQRHRHYYSTDCQSHQPPGGASTGPGAGAEGEEQVTLRSLMGPAAIQTENRTNAVNFIHLFWNMSKHLVLLENLCNLCLKTSMKTQSVVVEQCVQTSSGHHGEPPWQRERREDPLQDETCWTGKCRLTVDEI